MASCAWPPGHPDQLTTEGRIANRHGRLYLDIGRNGYAQTMAARLAAPDPWAGLDEAASRLEAAGARLARLG